MGGTTAVQAKEMSPVQGEQGAPVGGGKGQNRFVRHRLAGLPAFLDGHDVVAKSAQFLHDGQREVFVRI
jgi:hypothetical protein